VCERKVHGDVRIARVCGEGWVALGQRLSAAGGGSIAWGTDTGHAGITAVFQSAAMANFLHRWAGLASIGAECIRSFGLAFGGDQVSCAHVHAAAL